LHSRAIQLTICAVLAFFVAGRSACAATATSLSSFEGREEPTVLYHPSNGSFTNDSYVNITDQGGGVIRYTLRYQPDLDWWDGDRNTTNDDRQRAEVKGLGAHQKTDQTFRYSFDWRTDPNYKGTGSFCHIFQLKSTDGDSGAPLVTLSLGTNGSGTLRIWSGTAANSSTARSFTWTPNTWSHADIIITTSQGNTGAVIASINGDGYSGTSGVPAFRPDATDYRPKWGLYRGINSNLYVGTNWVEDREVTAVAHSANDVVWNASPSTDTAWNTTDTNNWIKSGLSSGFANGNNVYFTNARVGNVVVAGGGVTPGSINVSHTMGTYTFSGGAIGGSGTLVKTGAGTLVLANTNTFTGGTTVTGGTLAVNGSLAGTVSVGSGATLQGSGSVAGAVTVANGGTFAPGNSLGIISVGSAALNSGSTLSIELGGTTAGTQYDRLNVAGSLALAGTLRVTLANNYTPAIGDAFDILDWGSRSGTFSALQLPTLSGPLVWNALQLYSTGVLSVALPGDYNQDGTVDTADFIVWRENLGSSNYLPNDLLGGTIGSGQYDQWRSRFGQSADVGSAASIERENFFASPEPATVLLAALGLLLRAGCMRRAGRIY
jgi:autotransporter-associated beta strand protein